MNAVGSVIDPRTGKPVAGVRTADGRASKIRLRLVRRGVVQPGPAREATTIGVMATNARLTKAQALKVAEMAHDGLARAIVPSHTPSDGDTLFMLATGDFARRNPTSARSVRSPRRPVADAIIARGASWRAAFPATRRGSDIRDGRSDLFLVLLVIYSVGLILLGTWVGPRRSAGQPIFLSRADRLVRASSSPRSSRPTSAPAPLWAPRVTPTAMVWPRGGGTAARVSARWCWRSGSARESGRRPMQHSLLTVGDFLEHHFGRKECVDSRHSSSGPSSFFMLCSQLKGAAIVLNIAAGWDSATSAFIAAVLTVAYFILGGLKSAAIVNGVQLAVILIGFLVAAPMARPECRRPAAVQRRLELLGRRSCRMVFDDPAGAGVLPVAGPAAEGSRRPQIRGRSPAASR